MSGSYHYVYILWETKGELDIKENREIKKDKRGHAWNVFRVL